MIILGLDCAGAQSSVAIVRDGNIIVDLTEPADKGKGDRFVPLIERAVQQAGLEPGAIDRIAVNTGPGSFTGIRIALAAAQGLALALNKDIFGIDAFALWQQQSAGSADTTIVVLESRRDELYVKAFDKSGAVLLPATSMLPKDIAALNFPGTISFTGDALHYLGKPAPQSHSVAAMAALHASALHDNKSWPCTPTYIRDADVSIPT